MNHIANPFAVFLDTNVLYPIHTRERIPSMVELKADGLDRRMAALRIVPVVVIEDVGDALPLCDALDAGGLPIAEVTFRTDAATEAIAHIGKERPNMLLGAGTVLTAEQVAQAADAGATFMVTPGLNPNVVEAALRHGLPIIPGVNNPSQIELAMSFGLQLLKFFPAEASGGRAMLKALSGPYRDVRFIPIGGIGPANLANYLSLNNVAACGGSWMVETSLVAERNFSAVTELTRQAREIARSVP